jgi:hypothetical protein
VKWGVRPNLTADFTINTDFAQVEADEEQVNLTRFDLFFPEKRPFFLENASVFQFGAAQLAELFFSRRIGLSATGASGVPIDIFGGGRLSGKVGGYNIGILDMQTETATDARTGALLTPANNFGVIRVQREVGRSNFGGIYVNREGTGDRSFDGDYNRAYGLDAALQVSTNSKLFTYLARTDSPAAKGGSDYSGRVFYNFTNNLWQVSSGYTQVGEFFNPEVGYLPRRGYRRPSSGPSSSRSPSDGRGSGASRRTSATTPLSGSGTARFRPRTGTTTSSRSSRRAAGGSAPSSRSCRTDRSRLLSSSMRAATASSSRPGSTPGTPSPTSSRAIRAPRSPGRSGLATAPSTTVISGRSSRRWRCGPARGSRPRSATHARTSTSRTGSSTPTWCRSK